MNKTVIGVVHGKTIEFDEDLGVAEGQTVEVQLKVVASDRQRKWGDGIIRSAGGWAQYPEMDEIMERIHLDRKLERRPQMESQ